MRSSHCPFSWLRSLSIRFVGPVCARLNEHCIRETRARARHTPIAGVHSGTLKQQKQQQWHRIPHELWTSDSSPQRAPSNASTEILHTPCRSASTRVCCIGSLRWPALLCSACSADLDVGESHQTETRMPNTSHTVGDVSNMHRSVALRSHLSWLAGQDCDASDSCLMAPCQLPCISVCLLLFGSD